MGLRPLRAPALTLALALAATANARVTGGGPAATDCYVVWEGVSAARGTSVVCEDGDPACDADGARDGACTFGVNACLGADEPAGCVAAPVERLRIAPVLLRAGPVVTSPLALPTGEARCGTAALVRLPLRGRARPRASRRLRLGMTATAAAPGRLRRDVDRLVLRCVPNAGRGACPPNPAGGPRELRLTVAERGTDLDNGWIGIGHNFPFVAASTFRGCLGECDRSADPTCTLRGETGPGTINGPGFGPPLPLFVIGSATCIVNRFAGPITGSANLETGAVDLSVQLEADVWVAPPNVVCPQCSGQALGDTGVCQGGPDAGRPCRVEGTVFVSDAGGRTFRLSSACRPEGTRVASLEIPLEVSTGTRTLGGSRPCPGQLEDDGCPGGGTCTAPCAGAACARQGPDPVDPSRMVCVDRKGGVSQVCCSSDPTLPCFPTALPGGVIERTGRAAPPVPAWPEPTYPKRADAVVVGVFCEPATGQNVLDAVTTGLPGPAAAILPVDECWIDDADCG